MPGKPYVERINLDGRLLFTVVSDPNGVLLGNAGDLALRKDAPNGTTYVNVDGAMLWRDLGPTVTSAPFIRLPFAGLNLNSATKIPAGNRVTSARVVIEVAYAPGTTIDLGQPGLPASFIPSADIVPTQLGTYEVDIDVLANNDFLRVTFGGAIGAGSGTALVFFEQPLP